MKIWPFKSDDSIKMPIIKKSDFFPSESDGGVVHSLNKFLKQRSNPEQLAIGGVLGGISGLISMKIGKTVATVVGGSLILFQLAHYQGYIKINWSKVNKDVNEAAEKINVNKKELSISSGSLAKIRATLANSPYFCNGFIGGFLIGIAF